MRKIVSSILIYISIFNTCFAQDNYTPIILAKKLMSTSECLNISNHFANGFDGHPNGLDIKSNVKLSFQLLDENNERAVVNITFVDSLKKEFDTYLHFEHDSIWKIKGLRALAMTGIIEKIIQEMETMTDKQIEEQIKKQESDSDSFYKSTKEFNLQLRNLKLILESDNNIIRHFEKNKDRFEELKNKIVFLNNESHVDKAVLNNYLKEYNELLITGIDLTSHENYIEFLIGGMIDNVVGYYYIPNKNDIPKMSPHRLIMIREIGNGWYLFKTT